MEPLDLDVEIAGFIVEKLKILQKHVETSSFASFPFIHGEDIPALLKKEDEMTQWKWIINEMIHSFDNYSYQHHSEEFYFGRRLFAKYFTHLYT